MKKPTFFRRFLFPLLLVGALSVISITVYMFTLNMKTIEKNAIKEAGEIANLLEMAENLVNERVRASMALFKYYSLSKGAPEIAGMTALNDETVPNLVFGKTPQTSENTIVDQVAMIGNGNGSATLFVKHQNELIRIATNIKKENQQRAINTRLSPRGKAIKALSQNQPYYGIVDILNTPYISGYEPIFNKKNEMIGAWYVGYKVNADVLDVAIKKWGYLKSGFIAVTDYNRDIRFLSESTSKEKAKAILEQRTNGWNVINKKIEDWDFQIHIAYPANEAYLQSIGSLYPLLFLGGIFGLTLLGLARQGIQNFIITPLGGDPEHASALVSRIRQGDLDEDGTEAEPNTLIGNMLDMRRHLREMVTEIKDNADRLSVSSSVFEHAHDGIFITDANADIIDINPAFTRITGYTREESMSQRLETLGFSNQANTLFSTEEKPISNRAEWRGEIVNYRKNGDSYTASLDIQPVNNDKGVFQHYVGLFSDISNLKQQQEALKHMAYHDALTQLPNRSLFSSKLQSALNHAKRTNEVIAICYFDLDNFKPINDKYGHEIGDQLLILLAKRIDNSIRDSDVLARFGGDEFAMLLTGLGSVDAYGNTLERLLIEVEKTFTISDLRLQISASIGYTIFPVDQNPPDILLRHADHAMYHAKTNGGNQYHLFDLNLAKILQGQKQLQKDVEEALKKDHFELYYQPQINIKTGELIGMEALIRWQHPEKGLLQPNDFLPHIENTPLITPLGEWVIREALAQMSIWQSNKCDFQVSVNIAAHHLLNKNFDERLTALLAEHPDATPSKLNLEITETAAINDIDKVTKIIQRCKKLGVTFAIDDFGTGYSSLTYLRRLPVDTIKIDRSFVAEMLNDANDLALVSSVITLCKEFRLNVIAEGLESLGNGQKLISLGCDYAQGFGISKPMKSDEVTKWINRNIPFNN